MVGAAPGGRWTTAAFFLLAVSYSIGWNAVSSELARYASQFSNDVLLKLSLAYFIPSVLLSLSSSLLSAKLEARLGRHRLHLVQATLGFGGCAAALAALPYLQHSLRQLLAAVAALGVASSTAFGCSYQLASSEHRQSSIMALSTGFIASAPVVLAIEAALRLGPRCPWHKLFYLYESTACIAAAGLIAAVALARQQQQQERQQQAWPGRQPLDDGREAAGLEAPLLLQDAADAMLDDAADGSAWQPYASAAEAEGARSAQAGKSRSALLAAWPAAAALSLGVSTSMFLFPFLTHVPARQLGMMLPVVLFWTRCFSDIAGRLLPRVLGPPPRPLVVLGVAALRTALLPLALLYVRGSLPAAWYSDWWVVGYVALQWLAAGAINIWAYLLLPGLVPAALLRRATAGMVLAFNAACLAGLLLAIPFSRMVQPGAHP